MKPSDTRPPGPAGQARRTARGPLLPATAVAAACLVTVGVLGTFSMRGFGRVPFSVPSWPWYYSWPSYLFWSPALDGPATVVVAHALADFGVPTRCRQLLTQPAALAPLCFERLSVLLPLHRELRDDGAQLVNDNRWLVGVDEL